MKEPLNADDEPGSKNASHKPSKPIIPEVAQNISPANRSFPP